MCDHDEPAQPEEVAAAGRLGIEARPQPRAAGRTSRPPTLPRVLAPSSERSAPRSVRIVPFERLQRHVAGEAVADDDVAGSLEQLAALDVAVEAERARLEERVRLERELVPLLRLLADREQPHRGRCDVEDLLGEDRAHVAELEQVLRRARRRSRRRR